MAEKGPLRLWRGAVLPAWIDYNGHMSEGYYGLVFGMASDEYLLRMGFDGDYRARVGGAFYTVETHLVFVDELAEGTPLTVDTTVAGGDLKRVHLLHELRTEPEAPRPHAEPGGKSDETKTEPGGKAVGNSVGKVAAVQESMMLHVDTSVDRVAEMGADLYEVLRADARAHRALLSPAAVGRAIRPVGA